jgi:myo-inositol-1(or 4)-monophosphatase
MSFEIDHDAIARLQPSLELKTAIEAASVGSSIVARYFQEGIGSTTKTVGAESAGLVTRADLESEQAIVAEIRKTFPAHNFLGEESYSDDSASQHLWIIDPLDGTNNFAHGIPRFAVSVGYYRDGVAQCGAVVNPVTGELFSVEKGRGAFHNGAPTQVNRHSQLNQTMIATGFYYDRGKMMEATLAAIGELFHQNIQGIRRFGAASLDLIDVGLGRYGGYFEFTLSPWDFAAAKLFVEEAGGQVTTCTGEPMPLAKLSLLASNGLLHQPLLDIVSKHAGYFLP